MLTRRISHIKFDNVFIKWHYAVDVSALENKHPVSKSE